MMLGGKVVTVFALCLIVLTGGMPQSVDNGNQNEAPPLIQFTNGGIRFNFGGYHAEAGLGGLLTGSKTGGGLHASAGTPWGAHAGAGLGGLLGGDDGNAGGGLYARAGLGNGRPEAVAGLGGLLDGSGRANAPARGGLFAGATTGARGIGVSTGVGSNVLTRGNNPLPSGGPSFGASLEGSNNKKTTVEAIEDGKAGKGGTNIQIIAKKAGNRNQASGSSTNPEPSKKDDTSNKEIREAGPEPVPASVGLQPVDQVKVVGTVGTIEPAPPVPLLTSDANEIVQVDNRPQRVRVRYPKWIRKRLFGPRKEIIHDTSLNVQNPSDENTQRLSRRQTGELVSVPITRTDEVVVQSRKSDEFYDDVFNIPVSTLNAVNQLLNNNFG